MIDIQTRFHSRRVIFIRALAASAMLLCAMALSAGSQAAETLEHEPLFKGFGNGGAPVLYSIGEPKKNEVSKEKAHQPPSRPGAEQDLWTRPFALGDWGGVKSYLSERGVDIGLRWFQETGTNARGGSAQRVANAGQTALAARFDLLKIFGLAGGSFNVTMTNRYGRDLGHDARIYPATVAEFTEIYGFGDTVRLTSFNYVQTLFDGAMEFKFGRMNGNEDFFYQGCYFLNLSFCGVTIGNMDPDFLCWPRSAWGGRARFFFSRQLSFMVGALDQNQHYSDRAARYAILPSIPNNSYGTAIPMEIEWTPTFSGYGGYYKLGAFYTTSKIRKDNYTDIYGNPIALTGQRAKYDTGSWAITFQGQQQLTTIQDDVVPGRGLFVFLNMTFNDQRTVTTDRQITGGLLSFGPFDSRPRDQIGIAFGTTHFSSRRASTQALANLLGHGPGYTQTGEFITEAFYGYQVAGWGQVKGSVQYVRHPGGYDDANRPQHKDAVVFALRTVVDF